MQNQIISKFYDLRLIFDRKYKTILKSFFWLKIKMDIENEMNPKFIEPKLNRICTLNLSNKNLSNMNQIEFIETSLFLYNKTNILINL